MTVQSTQSKVFLTYDSKGKPINQALLNANIPGTTIVRTQKQAKRVVGILKLLKDRFHAWDTETYDLEVKKDGPVGKGKILCATAFCGPQIDFGNGPRLFVDNFADSQCVLNYFKAYFENSRYLKVFHNFSFDKHVIQNQGINVKGFGGDTMHMARLLNPSLNPGDYSLAKLSQIYSDQIQTSKIKIIKYLKQKFKQQKTPEQAKQLNKRLNFFQKRFIKRDTKTDFKTTFGRWKEKKDGTLGQIWEIPNTPQLHTNPKYTKDWVQYAGFDAEVTYFLRETIASKLCALEVNKQGMKNLLDVYKVYWKPFGELLVEMERQGIKIDIKHLREAQAQAEKQLHEKQNNFLKWVYSTQPKVKEFNPNSSQQLQHLLFAPFKKKNGQEVGKIREFNVENQSEDSGKKFRKMQIQGLGIPFTEKTSAGMPSADQHVIRKLAGKDPYKGEYGMAHAHFMKQGKRKMAVECSKALHSWLQFKSIETLLSTYIMPLQNSVDQRGRVHCSLNFNTETGRLSARKPNLQNQPAYDKDIFKIRKAFIPDKGKRFIVADYGQLQLRILAHMTSCKSMIEAFRLGGDFHSRTAMGMHPQIKQEIQEGQILLQWDYSKGDRPPKPLLKQKYAAQRKKAKGLNFSIAYGKTAAGFAKDWGCSIPQANQVIQKWYSDRIEVKQWQDNIKKIALDKGWTQTLIGRYRDLTKHFISTSTQKSHGLRAAINTPIQGGAADCVIGAMVKIWKDKKLRQLGWKLLLQVHDQVILQGPTSTANQAMKQVVSLMENPLNHKLNINLQVDAKIGKNWYDAK